MCYGAQYRIRTAVQSHFGYSYFISVSWNCNSYCVLNTCYVLLAFHPYFLTCITALLASLSPIYRSQEQVSRGIRDLCEVLWPISSRIYIQSKVCLTSWSELSPPPSCLCLKGNHRSRTDITLQSVPLRRCGLMNSQRIKYV